MMWLSKSRLRYQMAVERPLAALVSCFPCFFVLCSAIYPALACGYVANLANHAGPMACQGSKLFNSIIAHPGSNISPPSGRGRQETHSFPTVPAAEHGRPVHSRTVHAVRPAFSPSRDLPVPWPCLGEKTVYPGLPAARQPEPDSPRGRAFCREPGCGPPGIIRLSCLSAYGQLPNCLVGPVSAFFISPFGHIVLYPSMRFSRPSLTRDHLDVKNRLPSLANSPSPQGWSPKSHLCFSHPVYHQIMLPSSPDEVTESPHTFRNDTFCLAHGKSGQVL
ncbi:hypothetical protein GGR52DRAFT_239189 [Hypoxylon sp. FL1284]|nr:hypothetical protein GGR52DRAFT_239189 [Hypoxylon sp. FL1284]